VITCLTAQNSIRVTAIHTPPVSFLKQQWEALVSDMPPMAIKIGMLGSKDMVITLGSLIKDLRKRAARIGQKVWIVLDPVMISTSGSRLIDLDAQQALIDHLFPSVDIITPNLFEAQALLEVDHETPFSIQSLEDMEIAASKLLKLGCSAVLLKGGHFSSGYTNSVSSDYLLIDSSSSDPPDLVATKRRRLCDADESSDASSGVWLQSPRYDTMHTHGTGCTLSSALASALAIGEDCRRRSWSGSSSSSAKYSCGGAFTSLKLVDAACLAKAYVTAGISQSRALLGAKGPGPVAHTTFPHSFQHYPFIRSQRPEAFRQLGRSMNANADRLTLGRVLPIVDSVEWVDHLCEVKLLRFAPIEDIQFRIKGESDPLLILAMIKQAKEKCEKAQIRLWINDFWKEAVAAGCFGVHLGQEDLYQCSKAGGIDILRQNNMALGISTHSFGELSVALGMAPSYISLGPIYATSSKSVQFDPQGLDVLRQWRQLIPPDLPVVAIGGINDVESVTLIRQAGADCIAVIGAVTGQSDINDISDSILRLDGAMHK
jgi:hydroxymethylpyrimidine kinase / phosphomethylpyrimidine kinase / thiamine-phosphate diphosphorylase